MPASFITHHGKKILYANYRGIRTEEEMMSTLNEVIKHFRSTNGQFLTLIDITDALAGKEWTNESKKFGQEFKHKVEKSAIVGVSGMKKVILMGYNAAVGGRVKPFDTKEAALDYLVKG